MESKKIYDLSEQEIRAIIDPVLAKLKEFPGASLEFNFVKTFVSDEGKEEKNALFALEGSVGNSEKVALDKLVADIKATLAPYGEEVFQNQVEITFSVGEKSPDVEKVEVIPTKEAKTFACPPGEVVLIDFWATWCGPCQKPMAHNQEMLEKNEEKWKGKARIVGVSLDDNMDAVIKRIEEKKWDKVEHYWSPGGFGSDAAQRFGIQGIPHVLLVDKEGKIAFVGHPSECDLEAKINELIEGGAKEGEVKKNDEKKDEEKKPEEEEKPKITLKEQEDIFKVAESEHNSVPKDLPNAQGLGFVVQIANTYSKSKQSLNGVVVLRGTCTNEDTSKVAEWGKGIYSKFPSQLRRINRLVKRVTPEVKFGTACAACKAPISQGTPHWVCTKCIGDNSADYAFCVDCADKEAKKDIQSAKDLLHPHGLLFVEKNATAEDFKSMKRQFNAVAEVDEEAPWFAEWKASKKVQGVNCDGCREGLTGYRWACAHCPDFDFCDDCYKASKDASNPKHEKMLSQSKERGGHDVEKHLFYRAYFLAPMRQAQPAEVEIPE